MEALANKKTGIYALGLVVNKETFVEELNNIIDGDKQIEKRDIDQAIDNNGVEYLNGAGYMTSPEGKPINKDSAKYIRFKVPFYKNGEQVIGWFVKDKTLFTGVTWGTISDFDKMRILDSRFNMGAMYFDLFWDGSEFLEDIAVNTIPESWKYKNKQSGINHPILKAYLENILNRLIKEDQEGRKGKIVFSQDKKYAMFNTNLLDKYFHEVIIVGELEYTDGEIHIKNPSRSTSRLKLRKIGFDEKARALPPQFFDDVNEVIFQTSWEIDRDFDTFTHIIEDRIERFPEEYHNMSTEELATKFDNAIDFAVALAQRNYKFIVPMYRPQEDKIQLLMPIYLKGTYSDRPDFALILTPNKELCMYEPETILPLDAAYQNARLIAKPEESWLNPDEI
jgi:hypothetical protein